MIISLLSAICAAKAVVWNNKLRSLKPSELVAWPIEGTHRPSLGPIWPDSALFIIYHTLYILKSPISEHFNTDDVRIVS